MTKSHSRSRLHVMSPPISEAEEIPYDPAKKGPGSLTLEIRFERDEIDRLKARSSRGTEPLSQFVKRAALEAADAEARRSASDELREVD